MREHMETQIFDLSKRLLTRYDKVAYLVDAKNVHLYYQYIEKYCGNLEPEWYEEAVMSEIHQLPLTKVSGLSLI